MRENPTNHFSIEGRLKRGHPAHLDIKIHNQFESAGLWLRGNLHCHAGGHSGAAELSAEVCEWYRNKGFDFVAVRHTLAEMGEAAAREGFVPLLGDEFRPGHVLGIGIEGGRLPLDEIKEGGAGGTASLVKAIQSEGGVAVLAHPFWSAWEWDDLIDIMKAGAMGFEVANGSWRHAANSRSDQIWSMVLNAGYRPAAVGGDDSHSLGDPAAGKSWTGVLAAERSPEAILDAIVARRTYASEGPELLGLTVAEPGRVIVKCSPCRACYFSTTGWPVKNEIVPDGGASRRFELDLAASGYRLRDYLVIVLEDLEGNRAWTSAIDVEVRIT